MKKPFWKTWAAPLICFFILHSSFFISARAQDHTIVFSTSDPGVSVAITNWGLDTGWPNYDNMYRGLLYMGTNTVNLVQVAFEMAASISVLML